MPPRQAATRERLIPALWAGLVLAVVLLAAFLLLSR